MNYRYYGVTVSSEVPLPLEAADPAARSRVAVRLVRDLPRPDGGPDWKGPERPWRYRVDGESTSFWLPGRGGIAVHGARGLIEVEPDGEPHRVEGFLLITALPCALSAAGRLTLHAGAVVGPAGAVAIGGLSGKGKSTSVAWLAAAGWQCLHDDLTVLTPDWVAHPGPRTVWLRPDAAAALGAGGRDGRDGKVPVPVGAAGPSRLEAVVLLDARGGAVGLRRLGPANAAVRMGLELGAWPVLGEHARRRRFQLLGRLAEEVACYAWSPPAGIADAGRALDVALRERASAPNS